MRRILGTFSGRARIWDGVIPGTHEPGFQEPQLIELPVPPEVRAASQQRLDLKLYRFTFGECNVLLGHEPGGVHGEMRWHLTISHPHRHPTWDEIKTVRYRLLGPDTVMAMILPPVEHFINVPSQDHVFQLWEIEDESRLWEKP